MKIHRSFLIVAFLSFQVVNFPRTLTAYNRIISLKPNLTEILFSLGAGDKIVGDTTYCKHPPEAQKIEKIGGYSNPNLEKILFLKPDLVVMVPDSTSPRLELAIRRAGIETLILKTDSINDIYDTISQLSKKIDSPEKGDRLIQSLKKQIQSEVSFSCPVKKGIFVVQRNPLIVVGSHTFLSDLLQLASIDNIAGQSKLPYPHLSFDQVLAQRPEIIFDMDPAPATGFWEKYSSLPAVKTKSIIFLTPDLFIPGPRLPEALKQLLCKH